MDTLIKADIFFFISALGFSILFLLLIAILFYVLRAASTFNRIIGKLEKDLDNIGDATKEFLEEIRDSFIFNFIFGRKKKRNKRD